MVQPLQWHRDTPQQSLTVAGAAQESRLNWFRTLTCFPFDPSAEGFGAPENVAGFYPIPGIFNIQIKCQQHARNAQRIAGGRL
jgi:hypothetical protein